MSVYTMRWCESNETKRSLRLLPVSKLWEREVIADVNNWLVGWNNCNLREEKGV